ncbi:3-oxoacyl-[acyl-carrier protein] reductase [Virgibacillus natechei]|uniref:3-oxoacyl-[acyl-carrier protein] reductase n=1 Tax=Virgibacillus natechei TaxID=1216297 RepID=A0ABS4IKX8_9BACI|nr:SDR family oxidoreductase [Virgibacillus natechei]MBP1971528.1 3-oxoacyl-[acyl-carrier protein] reductase [Virgibacillus natechei]UZD12001.1 SDR family oxidoreductase [Virgibacillus natechei]
MDLDLKGKSVVITAASKGLGKAVATEFAHEGAHVLISSRNADTLQQTVKEIKQETGNENVDYATCDMKDAQEIKGLVEKAVEWNGTVDVLINNAGGPPAGKFIDMEDEDWYHAFELNLLSFIRSTREVIPYMKEQKRGHIVNLASSSIKQTLDNLALSNTMRPGIVGMAKSLSQEVGEDNILVNTVGPGTIETDRIMELNQVSADKSDSSPEAIKQEAEQAIPMNRYGQPHEFAKAIVFLASGANTYITGQSLIVDGGLVKAL